MTKDPHANSLPAFMRKALPGLLPDFLARQRWFGGKARSIEGVEIFDLVQVPTPNGDVSIVLAKIKYAEGDGESYAIPLIAESAGDGAASDWLLKLNFEGKELNLRDAFLDNGFLVALFDAIRNSRTFKGSRGELTAHPAGTFREGIDSRGAIPQPSLMKAEQSNTSVRYGERYILKFFRRMENGLNPDVEIGRFLTDKASFEHSPSVWGTLEYATSRAEGCALGILQDFVPNHGDAWRFTLGALEDYFQKAGSNVSSNRPALPVESIAESAYLEVPPEVAGIIGDYWESAGLLGRRTAQLHLALASDSADSNFRPESFSKAMQRSQYEVMRDLVTRVLRVLEKRLETLNDTVREDAKRVLNNQKELLSRFEAFASYKLTADCIRIHGDYHLGQVLYTGSDFVIIDFEGEPARPLEERRKKRCALQDVAGMLRSFHYAAYAAYFKHSSETVSRSPKITDLLGMSKYWHQWVSIRFLKEYLSVASTSRFVPASKREFVILLEAYMLEKAVYELGYELNNRPDWVKLPVQGILQLVEP